MISSLPGGSAAMILKTSFRFSSAVLISLLLFQTVLAQGRIGSVQGTVKDPSGALVREAKVTITQHMTGYSQTAQTDQQGYFKLVNIPFNTYKMQAEAPGFQADEQS